jgi:hypothetical protein
MEFRLLETAVNGLPESGAATVAVLHQIDRLAKEVSALCETWGTYWD